MILRESTLRVVFALFLSFFLAFQANAQDDDANLLINNIKSSLKTGSSRELSAYFNDVIELKADAPKKNVSKTQAEFILKDFFKKNPPNGFDIIHVGESGQGMRYMIGKYKCHDNSISYRVYTVIKKSGNTYLIHKLEFTKE